MGVTLNSDGSTGYRRDRRMIVQFEAVETKHKHWSGSSGCLVSLSSLRLGPRHFGTTTATLDSRFIQSEELGAG